jgi:hypothetical protein
MRKKVNINPGDVYEYNGESWVVTMVTSGYVTIESPSGKRWVTLLR